ncbi:signal peptidase I [Mediterraneibacter agrestimuris]|uniref:signal peptidase I n=1 Tax=Mediterraneibacter agrestimuris TaxID=2941333 RepID=UPI0020425C86|nr:signal peptidase I [Mediterraneibacter agrestimuris]
MKKALRSLFDLACAAVVIAALLALILQIKGIQPYAVVSGSMEPDIHVGSMCFIDTEVPYSRIREGDVIAFSQGDLQVTHRVIGISDQGMETKGDANAHSDGTTTTKKNYLGKNMGSVPYLGYVMTFLQTDRGKVMVLTGVTALFILAALLDQKEQDIQEDLI